MDQECANQYSVNTLCRICLTFLQNENSYNLFIIPGLAKKLIVCTSLSVEPQDGFPKNICGICYTRLNDFAEFQKLCVDSVQKFQEMLSQNAFTEPVNQFDILEPGAVEFEYDNDDKDEDEEKHKRSDRLAKQEDNNYDPLLNHKLEIIDNEDDVVKMLEHVEKDIENPKADDNVDPFAEEDFSSESSMSELNFPSANESDSSESSDNVPLAKRIRTRRSKDTNNESDNETKDTKLKTKRKWAKKTYLAQPIECHICHQKFKQTFAYQQHMKYHNDELPHQCTVESCLKGFTTASGLTIHIDHCHPELAKSIACPEEGCTQTFPRSRLLSWHLKKVHNKIINPADKRYPCTECEKIFKCPLALKKHMYKHDGKELPYPCNICGKRFVLHTALKEHLMRHAGIKNYVCPYCGVGKTTRQEWNKHVNTHTQEKKFKCELCPHASHNKQSLRLHVKIVHEKIKDFACQFCGKTFGKSHACKMHEMTHTGEKKYECKVCTKKFLYSKSLTKHLKTHEKKVLRAIEIYRKKQADRGEIIDPDSPLIPDIPMPPNVTKGGPTMAAADILKVCAESVVHVSKDPRRVELVNMEQLAGTAVNPIPEVEVPGVPATWTPQINFMLKEGPHVCPDCGQGFNGLGNMKRHHRVVHEGVKDFACRFCPKRFGKPDTLKHHEMTHTGEKPHGCPVCDKRFIQSVALKRHMRVHNPKPPTVPSSVYAAREELAAQERVKLEASRKAQEEREAIAEAAKEELERLTQTGGARVLPNSFTQF